MPGQEFGDRLGVLRVALHAQRQRLAAREDQKGVEGREARPEVAQPHRLAAHGEAEVAEGLGEADAVVSARRLGHEREAVALEPVEGAAVDDHAAHGVAVPAEVLGRRVHDDVGAMLLRPAEVGAGRGVVDDERHARLVRDLRDRLDVRDDAVGIGGALDEDAAGALADLLEEAFRAARVGEADLPVELREGLVELGDRAAVELFRRNQLVARPHEIEECYDLRGMTARHGAGRRAALERRDPLLEHRHGRVGEARVDVAEALQVEERGGMIGVVEDEGGGLVDGCRARAGRGIGRRPGMDRQRLEAVVLILLVAHPLQPSSAPGSAGPEPSRKGGRWQTPPEALRARGEFAGLWRQRV
jgi:hypothetical protein